MLIDKSSLILWEKEGNENGKYVIVFKKINSLLKIPLDLSIKF